jgi:NitT/TauT family transport system permease protein
MRVFMRILSRLRTRHLYSAIGYILVLVVWWILACTVFAENGIIVSPPETLRIITVQAFSPETRGLFWMAICQTLLTTIISFLVSFALGLLIAVLVNRFRNLHHILAPTITILRSMPTTAAIIVLLMILPWSIIPYTVPFLVTFPLLFENILGSLDNVPNGEIETARSLGMRQISLVRHIYIPNIMIPLWSNIISSFGLNYKVVIAAEILGSPKRSIGYNILAAKQSLDFSRSFAWLVVSVLFAWALEVGLRSVLPTRALLRARLRALLLTALL